MFNRPTQDSSFNLPNTLDMNMQTNSVSHSDTETLHESTFLPNKHPSFPLKRITPEDYGWGEEHLILGPADKELLEVCVTLGQGSLGIVEEVRLKNTQLPTFVRKRVFIPMRHRKSTLQTIHDEAKNLKSLTHPHIVSLFGSYEERKHNSKHFYCLLMSPVGDNDLQNFLEMFSEQSGSMDEMNECEIWVRRWFVCLASALEYMHGKGIRHQDIKPSNIIHSGSRIFFADFGSSSTFDVGHTTSTANPVRSSPMYAAPEMLQRSNTGILSRHGLASDIFSLGCVFCDMLNAWRGQSFSAFHDYLSSQTHFSNDVPDSPTRRIIYNETIPLIRQRFDNSTLFHQCILPMLSLDRTARPTAAETLATFLSLLPWYDVDCACIRL